MLDVISFGTVDVSFGVMGQRGVDGEYLGGELVGAATGRDQLSVGPSHVGYSADAVLSTSQADAGEFHFVQGELGDLPFAVDGQYDVALVVLLADGEVGFARCGVYREVEDLYAVGFGSDYACKFRVYGRDGLR